LNCENEGDRSKRAELQLVQRQGIRSDSDEEPSHHSELKEDSEPLEDEEKEREISSRVEARERRCGSSRARTHGGSEEVSFCLSFTHTHGEEGDEPSDDGEDPGEEENVVRVEGI